ncbi:MULTISPECIES: hypothetical protein [unclassified Agarivorans]|uniref:hypothetical protein n=1 Tax=unclassified Agarivorans TaxID=2636026 RepID=UPI0026E16FF3|nr:MULTISPECIES: hypothetical protein [unclassified Agarivorans]MDO6686642.1 hypothetical protein [Agarivorans sp. 3_MG-2023]MDO6717739.1 hypothetical protein [Agarivorans sp. 2_MG-2023]
MELKMYHGSMNANIDMFYPFSHFGSKFAATEAAFRRVHFNEVGTPTLYKVSIRLPDEATIEIPDWTSPRPRNLALALSKHFADERSVTFAGLAKNISISEASDKSMRPALFERISQVLLPTVKGIYYKNRHEGEANEISLCLACVQCVSSSEIVDFAPNDVEKVKAILKEKHPR